MKALLCLACVLVVGCSAEDPWAIRPPGGGGGVTGTGGGDDDGVDAGGGVDADGSQLLTGRVCVITAFDDPFACADIAASHGVLLEVVNGNGATAISDNSGLFSMTVGNNLVNLRVGNDASDGLLATRSVVLAADSPVDGFVVEEDLWNQSVAAIGENEVGTNALIYVVDSSGVFVSGATVTSNAPAGARQYYDDGAGAWDVNATATSQSGVAMILDSTAITATATLGIRQASVAIDPSYIGFAVITLPD